MLCISSTGNWPEDKRIKSVKLSILDATVPKYYKESIKVVDSLKVFN